MKLLHIADLHFGKFLEKQSLEEDQEYWIHRFMELVDAENPRAVLIAGDVYDTKQGSESATRLLALLLQELRQRNVTVCMVGGNHDSIPRLSSHGKLFKELDIHISEPIENTGGQLQKVTLEDEAGPVHIWLMPYVWGSLVKSIFPEEMEGDSFEEAVKLLLSRQPLEKGERNILVAHQNITSGGQEAEKGGSESKFIGGTGPIEFTAFQDFDYVALGHIHTPVSVGRETVRYAGSPICYHFNERLHEKRGVVKVELGAKGEAVIVTQMSVPPLHPLRQLQGPLEEMGERIKKEIREGEYVQILVEPEDDLSPEKKQWLRQLCEEQGAKLLLVFREQNLEAGRGGAATVHQLRQQGLRELFGDFYQEKTGSTLQDKDWDFLKKIEEQMTLSGTDGINGEQEGEELIAFLLEQEEEDETH